MPRRAIMSSHDNTLRVRKRSYAPIAANLPFGSDMNMIRRVCTRACARQPRQFPRGLGDEDIKRG